MKMNLKVAMIPFFMVVSLLMLSTGVSFAATASLYDSGSGTTTAPSGTSTFALANDTFTVDSNQVVLNLNKLRPFKVLAISVESVTLPSGVTFGQAADTTDGTVDGDVYQLYANIGNDPDNLSAAELFPLHNATQYNSAATPWPVYFVPEAASYAQFKVLSGVSAIRSMTLRITPFDVDMDSTLVTFDTQTTNIATSGVSGMFVSETSGGTGFYTPEGARWFGFFPDGDDVRFSTDGSEPSAAGRFFLVEKEMILPLSEVKRLGIRANGVAACVFEMTPYNRRPY